MKKAFFLCMAISIGTLLGACANQNGSPTSSSGAAQTKITPGVAGSGGAGGGGGMAPTHAPH